MPATAPTRDPAPTAARDRAGNRIFIWLLYAFLVLVGATLALDPALQTPAVLGPSLLLLALIGALHSQIGQVRTPVQGALYLAIQAVLVLALLTLAGHNPMTMALFFPLVGEGFALFPHRWQKGLALLTLFLIWAGSTVRMQDWESLQVTLAWGGGAFIFVTSYVSLYTRQAQERERAEGLLRELEAAHSQLKAYAARVEELTVAQERQRMARELHDTLAQGLAGLIMQLEAVDDLLSRGEAAPARQVTQKALSRARTALREARETIQALRTPLERGDLVEAIRQQIHALQTETGVACRFEVGPGELRIGEQAATQLFRVVQEGLTNVARHAQAQEVVLRLQAEPDGLVLEIADDGVGFNPAQAMDQPGHYGLVGLKERVQLAGGTLAIKSAPGQGTCLRVVLPPIPAPKEE